MFVRLSSICAAAVLLATTAAIAGAPLTDPSTITAPRDVQKKIPHLALGSYTVTTRVDFVNAKVTPASVPFAVECRLSRYAPGGISTFYGDKIVAVTAPAVNGGVLNASLFVSMVVTPNGQGTTGPAPQMQATCSLMSGTPARFVPNSAGSAGTLTENENDDLPTGNATMSLTPDLKLVGPGTPPTPAPVGTPPHR